MSAALLIITLAFAVWCLLFSVFVLRRQRSMMQSKGRQPESDIRADGIRDLVQAGDMERAIDAYQRFTGVDAFTARAAVETLQTQWRDESLHDEVERFLRLGDKAGAIEMVQQQHGVRLADALATVEAVEQQSRR